jgi:hypothetical protein
MIDDMKVRNLALLTQENLRPPRFDVCPPLWPLASSARSGRDSALSGVSGNAAYCTASDLVVPGPARRQNPITRHAVERACQEAHSRSGIQKPITPHSFRPVVSAYVLSSELLPFQPHQLACPHVTFEIHIDGYGPRGLLRLKRCHLNF